MPKSVSSQAADLGREGGKKGGPARAKALTRQERSAIARKGAMAKHAKHGNPNLKKRKGE